MNLGERIRNLRKSKKITQEELAKMIGVKRSVISKYENGSVNISTNNLLEISKALAIPIEAFLGNDQIAELINKYDNISSVKMKRFPLLGEIACGEPIFAQEDKENFIMADMDINADFCLTAHGDSMINARIHDGDIVFIKQMPIVDNGDIAAVIIDDEATLKRVYYYPQKNKLVLSPENPKYEPFVYVNEELDQIHILGKAVYFMSPL